MPSFVCDHCQETLKKAKLDQHAQRCRQAVFSCIDCYKTFKGTEYRAHFSCITEVQKYHQKQPVNNVSSNVASNSVNNSASPASKPVKSAPVPVPEESELSSAIKKIIKSSDDPVVSFKVIKKQLKKTLGKKSKKTLQEKIKFTLNKETNELVIKLN